MIALIQGVYYLATGLWPIIHFKSFEKASGPKRDKWLVKTLGLLIAAIGLTLIINGESEKTLGILSAAALGAAGTFYSFTKTISKVYLVEAFVEALIILGWLLNY